MKKRPLNQGITATPIGKELRKEYIVMAAMGLDDRTIIEALKKYFKVDEQLTEKDAEFWYALASVQYDFGRLTHDAKRNAVLCANRKHTFREKPLSATAEGRRSSVYQLREKLMSDYMPEIRTPKLNIPKALGQKGEILSCRLVNAEDSEWFKDIYIAVKIARITAQPLSNIMPELGNSEATFCVLLDYMGKRPPNISDVRSAPPMPIRDITLNGERYMGFMFEYTPKCRYKQHIYIQHIGYSDMIDTVYADAHIMDIHVEKLEDELRYLKWFNERKSRI
ncbi:MAG: hypothetical protein J5999_00440 [Oscillospiraceae bacterium]|nr:hypothetical protein [Oscillospiraceae bacterium]